MNQFKAHTIYPKIRQRISRSKSIFDNEALQGELMWDINRDEKCPNVTKEDVKKALEYFKEDCANELK